MSKLGKWQYSYVEKWADGSGIHERVTFDTEREAKSWMCNSAEGLAGWNEERPTDEYRLVASVERRWVYDLGEWEAVDAPRMSEVETILAVARSALVGTVVTDASKERLGERFDAAIKAVKKKALDENRNGSD